MQRGIEKFSLRKVAKQVGVSATACYNHFGNIDELLRGMYSYVIDRFAAALKQAVEDNKGTVLPVIVDVGFELEICFPQSQEENKLMRIGILDDSELEINPNRKW